MGGLYSAFRHAWPSNGYGPTQYPKNDTPVTVDVLEAGFLYAILILAVSLCVTHLPRKKAKETLFVATKIFLGIFIVGSIMLCNFGQEWEVAELVTKTPYRAGINHEIQAHIAVKVGLRSVNITLKTDPEQVGFTKVNETVARETETINYNERFSWNQNGWNLGRIGFGPASGQFNQDYRTGQLRGLPFPILWVAEYFTIDGEGIRWGRFYLQAGYYSHILLWLSFPTSLLTIVLLKLFPPYGAYSAVFTGCAICGANLLYATIRNPLDLSIPFEDGRLHFSWGWCFWLNLINGMLCILLGFTVWFMDLRFKAVLFEFLNIDIATELEEYYYPTLVDVTSGNDDTSTQHDKRATVYQQGFRSRSHRSKKKEVKKHMARMTARMTTTPGVSSLCTMRAAQPEHQQRVDISNEEYLRKGSESAHYENAAFGTSLDNGIEEVGEVEAQAVKEVKEVPIYDNRMTRMTFDFD